MKRLKISEIKIGHRKRSNKIDKELLESIKLHGLLNPVTVALNNGAYYLLDGLERLKCLRKLGKKSVLVSSFKDVDLKGYMRSKIINQLTFDEMEQILEKLLTQVGAKELAKMIGKPVAYIRKML